MHRLYRGTVKDSGLGLALSGFFAGMALQTHPIVALLFPADGRLGMSWSRGNGHRRRQASPAGPVRGARPVPARLTAISIYYNAQGPPARAGRGPAPGRHCTAARWTSSSTLETLRNLSANLLSSLSGSLAQRLTPRTGFSRPARVWLWLVAFGLVRSARRRRAFLPVPMTVLPLPCSRSINQNYDHPGQEPLSVLSFARVLPRYGRTALTLDELGERGDAPAPIAGRPRWQCCWSVC